MADEEREGAGRAQPTQRPQQRRAQRLDQLESLPAARRGRGRRGGGADDCERIANGSAPARRDDPGQCDVAVATPGPCQRPRTFIQLQARVLDSAAVVFKRFFAEPLRRVAERAFFRDGDAAAERAA